MITQPTREAQDSDLDGPRAPLPSIPAPRPPQLARGIPPAVPAGLIAVAGIVHLVLLPAHLAEARGAGLYFFLTGAAQITWALLYATHPTPRSTWSGIIAIGLPPASLYVLTRIMRAPFEAMPEPVDVVGVLTVLVEALAVALLAVRAWPARGAASVRIAARTVMAGVAAGLLVGAGAYGAGLGAETALPWLAQSDQGHTGAAHDQSAASHHDPGEASVLDMLSRPSRVGTQPYTGPTDGPGVQAACEDRVDDFIECSSLQLKALLLGQGAVVAFDALAELTEINPDASGQAHAIAHDLGRFAYDAYGDATRALSNCSYEVFQGCLHGVQQSYFDAIAAMGGTVNAQIVRNTCPPPTNAFQEYACLHGLGHGLMLYTNYAMNESLQLCDALPTYFATNSCFGGVFMENFVGYQNSRVPTPAGGHHGNGPARPPPSFMVKPEDPSFPCNVVGSSYGTSCWMMQTSLILSFNGGDFPAAAQVCEGAGEHRLTCYQSLGRDAASYANRDPAAMVQHCSSAPLHGRAACVRGFTGETVLHFNDPAAGIRLCGALGADDKAACFEETFAQGRYMQSPEQARLLCREADDDDAAPCRAAATQWGLDAPLEATADG